MLIEVLLPFLVIIAIATYVQTVSGFGLGMIVMGAVTVFELVPIAFTSVIISGVALINSLVVLHGEFKTFDRRLALKTSLAILPGLMIGLLLLGYMSAEFNRLLQLLLGATIIVAGVVMVLKPSPFASESKGWLFIGAGTASGILAGLFSIGGPPLIYLFYRQPLDLKTIRLNLLAIFLVSSIGRIALVGFQGGLTLEMLNYSLLSMPIVMAASWLGKRFPPPLSFSNMRRVAFMLLIVIGTSLILS